jgi:hypothetical protein
MVQRFYRNKFKFVGSIPHESKVILITDNWIRLAPRASGLRRKRQCGVPFSSEKRQKNYISDAIEDLTIQNNLVVDK